MGRVLPVGDLLEWQAVAEEVSDLVEHAAEAADVAVAEGDVLGADVVDGDDLVASAWQDYGVADCDVVDVDEVVADGVAGAEAIFCDWVSGGCCVVHINHYRCRGTTTNLVRKVSSDFFVRSLDSNQGVCR